LDRPRRARWRPFALADEGRRTVGAAAVSADGRAKPDILRVAENVVPARPPRLQDVAAVVGKGSVHG